MSNESKKPEWVELVKKYQKPDTKKALWQVINTLVPYIIMWYLMFQALEVSYWLVLPVAVVCAGLHIRLFIFQHDCGHNSFFPSKQWNNRLGGLLGILTLTPFAYWRKTHAVHHANSGNLDFRGIGDVETLTVKEYFDKDWKGRFAYRFFRHPLVTFGIGPAFVFFLRQRVPYDIPKEWKRERSSVYKTNVGIAILLLTAGYLLGFKEFFTLYITMMLMATSAGVWMFYVQHQFEDTYWRYRKEWDYEKAALDGSSFYKLPKILQWFTGNIGFHHIHHLAPRIPNYLLEQAHYENTLFQNVETLTVWSSLRTMFLDLWDEEQDRLISFRNARKLKSQGAAG
ncbi:MAG: fatty acid desaturase [Anaerolineae bacterium]|nr:fatty acid desaturase [Anaerolineae bacterium]